LFDQPVGALCAGVGEPGGEEHFDGGPPGLDRLGQGGQLGDIGVDAPVVEPGASPNDFAEALRGLATANPLLPWWPAHQFV
jgi:hypothetical protein